MESDDEIGIVGSKILLMQPYNRIWSAGGKISGITKRTSQYGQGVIDNGQFNQPRDVDFVSGCCMLIRREVFERIGTFNEDFFMYYEDVDFCVRAKAASYRILYWPDAVIWHNASASSNRSFRDYYRMRNHLWFVRRNDLIRGFGLCTIGLILFVERFGRILMRKYVMKDNESINARLSELVKGFNHGLREKIR
ncbi:MAG: glycosyltransferase [Candidatus Lokiarchaeota archaeon]|nr:glycosyltransferase [Candidatus Lokiarchaeota archaeon]